MRTVERLREVRLIANRSGGTGGLAVLDDGKIVCWGGSESFSPEMDGKDFVEVGSAGGVYAGLKADGSIETWMRPSKEDDHARKMMNPTLPGKAVALRTETGIVAVQLEDGTWHAWGTPGKADVVAAVNSLGRAVDLYFEPSGNGFWWIEPADVSGNFDPAAATKDQPGAKTSVKPGRLRLAALDPSTKIDFPAFEGVDDLVQIGKGFPNGPDLIGLRSNGQVVTSDPRYSKLAVKEGVVHLISPRVALMQDGRIVPLWTGRLRYEFADSTESIVDAEATQWGYILIQEDGQAIPGGVIYEDENPDWDFKTWPRPPADKLRNVVQAKIGCTGPGQDKWAMVLREDGSVYIWDENGEFRLPDEMPDRIVSIEGAGSFYLLDEDGTIWHLTRTVGMRQRPQSGVVALSRSGGWSGELPLYQVQDGSWELLQSSRTDIAPAWLKEVRGLPDEAFTKFSLGHQEAAFAWIEPAEDETSEDFQISPEIQAMKERGGPLKVWTGGTPPNGLGAMNDLNFADGVDDLVRIEWKGTLWGLRSNQICVSAMGYFHEKEAKEIAVGAILLDPSGQLKKVAGRGGFDLSGIDRAESVASGLGWAIVLLPDGTVRLLRNRGIPHVTEDFKWDEIEQAIDGLNDVVQIHGVNDTGALVRKTVPW